MKQDFIKNSPLFGELTDDEQRAISKRMRFEQYSANETLFAKGGESDALYLIKEGWVKLSDGAGKPVIASLGPGSLLGEADFFLGRSYTMTAQCTSQVTVWSLDQLAIIDLIAERPELGLYLGLAFGKGIVHFQQSLTDRLASIPFLQELSPRERGLIAQHLTPQRFYTSETLYRSGDPPTGLYFIEKGAIRLLGDTDDDYTELTYGEAFGEMAVVSGKPHSNTAQAASEVILWQLSPVDFNTITNSNPSIKTNLTRNLRARLSASDQAYALALLRRIPLFSGLARDALDDITRMLMLRHVPAGEMIFSQGDSGDAMYIIDNGTVDVISDAPGEPRELKNRFVDGDYFGETALLTGKTRDFTTHATSNVNLWCLYRTDFDNLLVKHPQMSASLSQALRDRLSSADDYSAEPHLQKIALLGGLSQTQLNELAALLQPRRYQGGSTIYYEGNASDEMYFIERGKIEHWATTLQGPVLLETLSQGDYFGEIALLSGRAHPGTAYALVETDIWALTKADFDSFLQRFPNLGVILSRILSERMEETMHRLRGSAPQRGLPAPGGAASSRAAAPPPRANAPGWSRPAAPARSGSPSRPSPTYASQPAYPAARGPQQPPVSDPASASRAVTIMPPVPVRPVTPPPGSRPQAALPARVYPVSQTGPQQPPGGYSNYSQPTAPMPPVNRQSFGPPIYSQNTQAMPPVPPPLSQSRPMHPVPPQAPPPQSRPQQQKKGRPRRKGKNQRPRSQHAAQTMPMPAATQQRPGQPPALTAGPPAESQSQRRQPGSTPPRSKRRPTGQTNPEAKSENRGQLPAPAMQPRSMSNRRLQQHRKSLSVWFANRTWGAKLRLLFIVLLIIWLCGIGAPFLIINALASTFADEGALPGDNRGAIQKISEDGAVGAIAVLPFVETATATPTQTPTPTHTPTQTPTPTETPIPTNTPTPTFTPTPTETPTPIFTPTPTDTPTRSPTRTPRPPTAIPETPTPVPTPTPNVDFRLKSVRQLTPCENRGKHHIFIKVEDINGQGINDVPVKVEWASGPDGHAIVPTETKTDLTSQLAPGHIDFAMFKGSYTVEIKGGTSEIAGPVTPDYGTNEACGEDVQANSLYHISYEVIFQRTF